MIIKTKKPDEITISSCSDFGNIATKRKEIAHIREKTLHTTIFNFLQMAINSNSPKNAAKIVSAEK